MSDREHDDELRAWFAEAREAEAEWTPSFERIRAGRPRPRPARWVVGAAAAALLAVVVIGIVFDRRAAEPPESLPPGIGQWRSATDFLLEGSGREILTTVPRIGDSSDWFTVNIPGKDAPS